MTFTSAITGKTKIGRWRVKYGTYTNDSGSVGGDINTGLGNVLAVFLQKTGAATTTDLPVVNESLPHIAGSAISIVTKADETGLWIAFEGQVRDSYATADAESTIIDVSRSDGKIYVLGSITEGGDGAVALDLTPALNKIEALFLQPLDTAVSSDAPVVNETFPVPANQSGCVTLATVTSKSYLFLAIGTRGGT